MEKYLKKMPGVVARGCLLTTWWAEEGVLWVWGQYGQYGKFQASMNYKINPAWKPNQAKLTNATTTSEMKWKF